MNAPTGRRCEVIGVGLIGGSVGLALRAQGWFVSGRDVDQTRLDDAVVRGCIDAQGEDLDAELVIIAVPAHHVAAVAKEVLSDPRRRSSVIVTDVAGVKATIVGDVNSARFIGGHPMAGSELLGLDGAKADLFVGATWVLTPVGETNPASYAALQSVIASLGASVVALDARDHDRMVAVVSHVPHLIAATLMNRAVIGAASDGALLNLAAGGFRDMTRVAAGDPSIWPEICVANNAAITATLTAVISDLDAVRTRIAEADRGGIFDFLEGASVARQALPARQAVPTHLSIVKVPVPDRHGVLAEVTTVASDLNVNIVDLQIAHSIEGTRGVLQLTVPASRARDLEVALRSRGFTVVIEELT